MHQILRDNFFRTDLNLSKKWWHRLLLVLFVGFMLFSLFSGKIFHYPRIGQGWKKIGPLSERITRDIKSIDTLLSPNEKIEENAKLYETYEELSLVTLADIYSKDTYYSTELAHQYKKIMALRNIDALYLENSSERVKVSPEKFAKYIKENDVTSLSVDSWGNHSQYFLQVPTLEPYQNFLIYRKSPLNTMFGYLPKFLLFLVQNLLLAFGLIFFYYKIILYIIFGSKTNVSKN